jgi:hypothetical protein
LFRTTTWAIPGLQGLDVISHVRRQHQQAGLNQPGHIDFVLAGPDGFHDDDIVSHGLHHAHRIDGRTGETAQVAPGRHRADINASVAAVSLHAQPVPEEGAAREGARRIHGDDADGFASLPVGADQAGNQAGLSRSRRPRHTQHSGLSNGNEKVFQDVAGNLLFSFDGRYEFCSGHPIVLPHLFCPLRNADLAHGLPTA